MDLKGTSNLDPKLKEAYERVMGTSYTPPATPPSAAPNTTAQSAQSNPQAASQNSASLQPPPVRPIQQIVAEEQPQPVTQPLPSSQTIISNPAPAPSTNPAPQMPEMVQSPQIFTNANPFQETIPPPGEVLAKNAVVPTKKMNSVMVGGFVVGGIVFFIVYGLIWAKVFGLF